MKTTVGYILDISCPAYLYTKHTTVTGENDMKYVARKLQAARDRYIFALIFAYCFLNLCSQINSHKERF